MDLIIGQVYDEITMKTEGVPGLEDATALHNVMVIDKLKTIEGKTEYVLAVQACSIPEDWIITALIKEETE